MIRRKAIIEVCKDHEVTFQKFWMLWIPYLMQEDYEVILIN